MRGYIFLGFFILIILCFIPLIWANQVVFDYVKFTEEWYKSIFSLVQILGGFYLFTIIYKDIQGKDRIRQLNKLFNKIVNWSAELENRLESMDRDSDMIEIANLCRKVNALTNHCIPHYNNEIIENLKFHVLLNHTSVISETLFSLERNLNLTIIDKDAVFNAIEILLPYLKEFSKLKNN